MSQDMKCNCMWNNELNERHNGITEKKMEKENSIKIQF